MTIIANQNYENLMKVREVILEWASNKQKNFIALKNLRIKRCR